MFAFARTTICAALVLTATSVAAAEPRQPDAHPALWKVESGGSTIYFFGSMHMLPRGLKWKTPIVERAMESSDIFFFEMPMSDGSFRLAAGAMSKNIFLPKGKTLSGMLSPAGKKRLVALAKDLGVNMKALDRMRPWSAAIVLSTAASRGEGTKAVAGVDKQVGYYALTANKTRRYFETGPQQAEMLARMGDADGAKGFELGMADARHTSQEFRQLAAAWASGDTSKLEKYAETGLENFPAGRKILLDERNQAWVTKVPELLQERRTFFVTVGAAHLAGHGSVIELLCGKDLKIQRIDTQTGNAKAACPAKTQVVAARAAK